MVKRKPVPGVKLSKPRTLGQRRGVEFSVRSGTRAVPLASRKAYGLKVSELGRVERTTSLVSTGGLKARRLKTQTVVVAEPLKGKATQKPFILLLQGEPAAGKSSFAKMFSKATGATLLAEEWLQGALWATGEFGRKRGESLEVSREQYEGYKKLRKGRSAIIETFLRKNAQLGVPLIIDVPQVSPKVVEQVHRIAAQRGVQVKTVRLTAPDDVMLERIKKRISTPTHDPSKHSPERLMELVGTEGFTVHGQHSTSRREKAQGKEVTDEFLRGEIMKQRAEQVVRPDSEHQITLATHDSSVSKAELMARNIRSVQNFLGLPQKRVVREHVSAAHPGTGTPLLLRDVREVSSGKFKGFEAKRVNSMRDGVRREGVVLRLYEGRPEPREVFIPGKTRAELLANAKAEGKGARGIVLRLLRL